VRMPVARLRARNVVAPSQDWCGMMRAVMVMALRALTTAPP
jgi:hypothetical protein